MSVDFGEELYTDRLRMNTETQFRNLWDMVRTAKVVYRPTPDRTLASIHDVLADIIVGNEFSGMEACEDIDRLLVEAGFPRTLVWEEDK